MIDAMSKIYDLARESKYKPNTYVFVLEILQVACSKEAKHLSGRQLTIAAFIYSIRKYGGLAKMVWEELGLNSSEDLGAVVFEMVEAGLMGKQEEDNVEDFNGLFTLEDFDRVKMMIQGTGGKMKYVESEEEVLKVGYRPPDDLGFQLP